ncbi:hypothetical protein, partial [Mycobacterium tuberculosis]|uniref:hypothetical protein n=1 Tax=Mycobacterium tuberculosis TaxID=1773 RepID=UPI000A7A3DAF
MTTVSEHAYSARVLNATGDIELSLDENNAGNVSLDADRIPHVEGQITIAVENAMLLENLDPRDSRRVVIEAKRADTFEPVY